MGRGTASWRPCAQESRCLRHVYRHVALLRAPTYVWRTACHQFARQLVELFTDQESYDAAQHAARAYGSELPPGKPLEDE